MNDCPAKSEDHQLLLTAQMLLNVHELEELIEQQRSNNQAQARLLQAQIEVLKAYSDLFTEMIDEVQRRKWLQKSILRAEREAARLRLPLWFWRPEEGLELKVQLYRRARFLILQHKTSDHDTWDLLREYIEECARPEEPVTDEQLSTLIEYSARKGGE